MTTLMRRLILVLTVLALRPAAARAVPMITEPAETLGRFTFEAGISVAERRDNFASPRVKYNTVVIPARARIGLARWMDVGFRLTHITQTLDAGSTEAKGSRSGLFSPEVKISPNENIGLLLVWHKNASEKNEQNLPVARGNDIEVVALGRIPTRWPVTLNAGYLKRESYKSKLGVDAAPQPTTVRPGDVFEASAALEVPLRWGIGLLTELAYYHTGRRKLGAVEIPGSEGDATDALVGLTWSRGGLRLGAAAGFGLGNESHTSFDLERGSGDVRYMGTLAYRLTPRKPNP